MTEPPGYCDICQNTGYVDCLCGGDTCVCGCDELICPDCNGGGGYDPMDE